MKYAMTGTLCLLCLGVSQLASATSSYRVIAQCDATNAGTDRGLKVQVSRYYGPTAPLGSDTLTATVSEVTVADEREIARYDVKAIPGDAMAAPILFAGPGFRLEIRVDTMPVNSRFISNVNYTLEGDERFAATFYCAYRGGLAQ